jgi:chitinase
MLNQGYDRYWDDKASVPYLYSSVKRVFVSYEDPESISAKCKYVVAHDLGGVMFLDYEDDPTGTLLRAINDGLQQHPSKQSTKP